MWAKLDDHYHDNPKILSVSIQARWIHTAAISWCSEHLTDGVIPRRQCWKLGAEDETSRPGEWIQELVRANLLEVAGPDAYRVHDYLEYNPTKEEAETSNWVASEQRRAAGKKRANAAKRDEKGRLLPRSDPAEHPAEPAESPAEHPATAGKIDPAEHPAEPAPFPFPFPYSDPEPELSGARAPAPEPADPPPIPDRKPDSSARSRSPAQEGTRAGPEPRDSGDRPARPDPGSGRRRRRPQNAQGARPASVQQATGPPGLTEPEGERLDHLRRRILATRDLQRHAPAIDRVVLAQLRRGAPASAIEQGLVSLLEHNPRDPAAYLAKVLRVEVPNHHEAAAIADGQRAGMTPEEARQGLARVLQGFRIM